MPKQYASMPPLRLTELNGAISAEIPATTFQFRSDFVTGGLHNINHDTILTVRNMVSNIARDAINVVLNQSDVNVVPAPKGDRGTIIPYRYYYHTTVSSALWMYTYHDVNTIGSIGTPHGMPYDGQLVGVDLINQTNGANASIQIRYRRNNSDQGTLLGFAWGGVRGRVIDFHRQGHFVKRGDTVAIVIQPFSSPNVTRPLISLNFWFPDIDQTDKTNEGISKVTTGW